MAAGLTERGFSQLEHVSVCHRVALDTAQHGVSALLTFDIGLKQKLLRMLLWRLMMHVHTCKALTHHHYRIAVLGDDPVLLGRKLIGGILIKMFQSYEFGHMLCHTESGAVACSYAGYVASNHICCIV